MRHYNIKPKPVVYRGIHFRSTLEGRWAVFFDGMKIKWEYEKEPFRVDSKTYYLPDFWLKDWLIEIKPTSPTDEEVYKALSVSLNNQIAIIAGNPNPLCELWLFQNGELLEVELNIFEQGICFAKGFSIQQWLNLKKLAMVVGRKRQLEKAFMRAEGYKFNDKR